MNKQRVYTGWWFGDKLGYGDGRIPEVGVTHSVGGIPECCRHGLHAGTTILNALRYAGSATLWRVEIWGDVDHNNDKITGTHRKYLWKLDVDDVLRDFARRCALDVIHLWDAPEVVVEYLKTGNEEIRDASWASHASWDASWASWASWASRASWEASRASQASWASWAASWEASRASRASRSASLASRASWASQNKRLTSLVLAEKKRKAK